MNSSNKINWESDINEENVYSILSSMKKKSQSLAEEAKEITDKANSLKWDIDNVSNFLREKEKISTDTKDNVSNIVSWNFNKNTDTQNIKDAQETNEVLNELWIPVTWYLLNSKGSDKLLILNVKWTNTVHRAIRFNPNPSFIEWIELERVSSLFSNNKRRFFKKVKNTGNLKKTVKKAYTHIDKYGNNKTALGNENIQNHELSTSNRYMKEKQEERLKKLTAEITKNKTALWEDYDILRTCAIDLAKELPWRKLSGKWNTHFSNFVDGKRKEQVQLSEMVYSTLLKRIKKSTIWDNDKLPKDARMIFLRNQIQRQHINSNTWNDKESKMQKSALNNILILSCDILVDHYRISKKIIKNKQVNSRWDTWYEWVA